MKVQDVALMLEKLPQDAEFEVHLDGKNINDFYLSASLGTRAESNNLAVLHLRSSAPPTVKLCIYPHCLTNGEEGTCPRQRSDSCYEAGHAARQRIWAVYTKERKEGRAGRRKEDSEGCD